MSILNTIDAGHKHYLGYSSSFSLSTAKNTQQALSFDCSVFSVPKSQNENFANDKYLLPSKMDCGEDAYFIAKTQSGFCRSIGIADGVGGWAVSVGCEAADSGEVSRNLMSRVSQLASGKGTTSSVFPKDILIQAYYDVLHQNNCKGGSTTACVLTLNYHESSFNAEATLNAANVGDSGFIVLRKELSNFTIIYRSHAQLHGFNCPFQLSIAPKITTTNKIVSDNPTVADAISVRVYEDDIIILATDGVFDNLFENEIVKVAEQTLLQGASLQDCAKKLVLEASKKAISDLETPFSKGSVLGNISPGEISLGGKLDDITVVVARLKREAVDTSVGSPSKLALDTSSFPSKASASTRSMITSPSQFYAAQGEDGLAHFD